VALAEMPGLFYACFCGVYPCLLGQLRDCEVKTFLIGEFFPFKELFGKLGRIPIALGYQFET
jgi:cadmium resistance protein CadD (predicted permease)